MDVSRDELLVPCPWVGVVVGAAGGELEGAVWMGVIVVSNLVMGLSVYIVWRQAASLSKCMPRESSCGLESLRCLSLSMVSALMSALASVSALWMMDWKLTLAVV